MNLLIAALAGGAVGALVAGYAYVLGRRDGRGEHDDAAAGALGSQVIRAAKRVDVGHSVFIEVERVDDTHVQVTSYRFGGEEE